VAAMVVEAVAEAAAAGEVDVASEAAAEAVLKEDEAALIELEKLIGASQPGLKFRLCISRQFFILTLKSNLYVQFSDLLPVHETQPVSQSDWSRGHIVDTQGAELEVC